MPIDAEQIGQQTAEQKTDDDVRIVEREVENDAGEIRMRRGVLGEEHCRSWLYAANSTSAPRPAEPMA